MNPVELEQPEMPKALKPGIIIPASKQICYYEAVTSGLSKV